MRVISRWQRPVAPREALVVLYRAMCAASHRRIRMVIEIAGEPSVFFSLLTRDYSSSVNILKLLGRVARVLDWAYPSTPCRRRGERLTMVGVVGVCFVFRKTQKNKLFLRKNSTER